MPVCGYFAPWQNRTMIRIGERWRQDKPYKDRPGAYAIIVGPDGHLLLVEQAGELQMPGGGIDPGESPLQALHREVREETGWRIAHVVRFGAFQRFTYMPEYGYWARKVQTIYLARAVYDLRVALEVDHIPIWMPPLLATRRLDVEGDRVMVARARRAGLI